MIIFQYRTYFRFPIFAANLTVIGKKMNNTRVSYAKMEIFNVKYTYHILRIV